MQPNTHTLTHAYKEKERETAADVLHVTVAPVTDMMHTKTLRRKHERHGEPGHNSAEVVGTTYYLEDRHPKGKRSKSPEVVHIPDLFRYPPIYLCRSHTFNIT